MKLTEIQKLAASLKQLEGAASIQETHISQVILTPQYAYKIPKTVQLPYLDFSSLEQRKNYCNQEIKLNRRLADGVYLKVVSIKEIDEQIVIGGEKGTIIDYAIKMKRLPADKLMSNMLKNNAVQTKHMTAIADQLVRFHRKAEKITEWPDIQLMHQDFADLLSVKSTIAALMGKEAAGRVEEWVFDARRFLTLHETRIQERYQQQFYIEIHGDLHAANIFLLDKPVIFDCIAFNKTFRQADILNELAFLCMDMDYHGRNDLGQIFLQHYLIQTPCIETEEDRALFQFYKLYRANVRLKINALKWQQSTDPKEKKKRNDAIASYYQLMQNYYQIIFQPNELPYQASLPQ